MTSRVVTSWMAVFGTAVDSKALEMTVDMAMNDSVDSLPPGTLLLLKWRACGQKRTFQDSRIPRLYRK
jgi:hypothetical protein